MPLQFVARGPLVIPSGPAVPFGQDGNTAYGYWASGDGTQMTTDASWNGIPLSTTYANDVVICYIIQGAGMSNGTPTSPNLTFQPRANANFSNSRTCFEYYAVSTAPLNNEVITGYFTNNGSSGMIIAFAVSGANTISPFDADASLPAITAFPTTTGPIFSTSNANDFIFGGICSDGTPLSGGNVGTGWSVLFAPGAWGGVEAINTGPSLGVVTSTQSNIQLNDSSSLTCNACVADAIKKAT